MVDGEAGSGRRPDNSNRLHFVLNTQSPLDEAIDALDRNAPQRPHTTETPEARRQRLEADRAKLGQFLVEQSFLDVAEQTLKAALDAGVEDFLFDGKLYKISTLLDQITKVYALAITDANVSRPIRKAAGIFLQQYVGRAQ